MKLAMWVLFSLSIFASMSAALDDSGERMYVDIKAVDTTDNKFHIQVGKNAWLETNAIFCDSSGMYILESNIVQDGALLWGQDFNEPHWQCPYCYMYWPKKVSCQNKDCPSRYNR